MNWRDYIHADPEILAGKPVVRGTRLSVEFLLGLLSNGWTVEQVLQNYPGLTAEALSAVFGYAADALQEESLYELPLRSTA